MKLKDDIPIAFKTFLNRFINLPCAFHKKKKSFCLSYTKYYESQSSRSTLYIMSGGCKERLICTMLK